jgi:hypothetical protein
MFDDLSKRVIILWIIGNFRGMLGFPHVMKSAADRAKEANQMIRATRRNSHWSPEEDTLLWESARSGESVTNIAENLGRTVGSVRIRAQRLNIALTRSGRLTACPGWLKLDEARTSFLVLPDRANIVRKIFELSIAGLGGYTIAKQLNAKNVPAFGPSPKWDQSTIHNMLRNRATVGEHQPKRYRNGKEFPEGDPIPNYYPAVIDEALFESAQEARRNNLASGRGRKGRLITNLFAGLLTCAHCGNLVKFHSNGNAKSLICTMVLEGSGCHRMGWSYRSFEESFFESILNLELQQTIGQSDREALTKLKTLIQRQSGPEVYEARLSIAIALKAALSKLTIASVGSTPPAGKPRARIRRDGPGRYFEIRFRGGAIHTGRPVVK